VRPPIAAGLVYGFQSADDFYLMQLRANRDVWVLRRLACAWQFVATAHAPPVTGNDVLALDVRGDGVTPIVNGMPVPVGAAPRLVGLTVEGGQVNFRVSIDHRGAPATKRARLDWPPAPSRPADP
jgi:hypothetical protein